MDDAREIRDAITAAGRLQEVIDRILVYGVVPRWLPLQVACFYAGLGEKMMMKLYRNGHIYATQDDGGDKWFFDRLSIDGYRLRNKKDNAADVLVENVLAKLSTKR